MKWKQDLLQDENLVLFMTKCLGEEICDVSNLVHNSQKPFSKAVIPDRKLKNMIRCYNEFPFELNFTVHDEALLMITLENNLKKWKFECPLHWISKLQSEVALSTAESEYIALSQD